MQASINHRLVQSLKPDPEKPYEVRDVKLNGFMVRVQPSGVMSYICQYARGKRVTLGRVGVLTPTAARNQAIDVLAAVGRGEDPRPKKINVDEIETLGEFLEKEYIPWFKANRKPPYINLNNLSSFDIYHSKKLEEISIKLIDRWSTKQRNKGNKETTIKRYINSIKAVLSKAVEWGYIEVHPLQGMKNIKTDDVSRTRFLSDKEASRLYKLLDKREERLRKERDTANEWRRSRDYELLPDLRKLPFADYLKPIVMIARNTGMRKGEILSLKWTDVNFKSNIVTVRGEIAKSKRTRHIPMNSVAMDVFKKWYDQSDDDELFTITTFKTAWNALIIDSKIKDFTFHDLRHDFASRLVMSGVDLKTIQELLGHADLTMTLRYSHLAPSHKVAAVERLISDG